MDKCILSTAGILIMMLSCRGIFGTYCPHVENLECYAPNLVCSPHQVKMPTVIKMNDPLETQCRGCQVCVDPENPCSSMGCPMWQLPAGCRAEFYNLYLNHQGRDCQICDTYECL